MPIEVLSFLMLTKLQQMLTEATCGVSRSFAVACDLCDSVLRRFWDGAVLSRTNALKRSACGTEAAADAAFRSRLGCPSSRELAARAPKSAVDLYMEDEKARIE